MKWNLTKCIGFAAATIAASLLCEGVAGAEIKATPYRVPTGLPDLSETPSPSAIALQGWLGARVMANATNRLLTVDTEPLLAGFKKKPGTHPWIGEHVGKWMQAATLAWVYTGDARLRNKLDSGVKELIAAQEPDGYLGTYVPEKRFGLYQGADWDVWSHKYNLIGLLTYYQYTGYEPALQACGRIGDLLINTFGPGKKSILSAGTHIGMASTSVLEPMVLLYRFTADDRYLEFCRYIVKSWDEPKGPHIIAALLSEKQVNRTANGKAYEMLSNLVGLCELARATGDKALLEPLLNAWEDISSKRLYITGSASQGEHFKADYELPNETGAHVAETCVTTTWIQLNLQLLRLTGDAKFGNELEKTLYNHLAAAQSPRGDDWCYFTALSGKKPYDKGINCCHSSGPRGMALAPLTAYLTAHDGGIDALQVSIFETSEAVLQLGGTRVRVKQNSKFPESGESLLDFEASSAASFAVEIRKPSWAKNMELAVNGKTIKAEEKNGWLVVPPRKWARADRLRVRYGLQPVIVPGAHGNTGLATLTYGPFVMAYDSSLNQGLPSPSEVSFAAQPQPEAQVTGQDGFVRVRANVRSAGESSSPPAVFVPFADAGAAGGTYCVWLREGSQLERPK